MISDNLSEFPEGLAASGILERKKRYHRPAALSPNLGLTFTHKWGYWTQGVRIGGRGGEGIACLSLPRA
jgi:hypothetical protein